MNDPKQTPRLPAVGEYVLGIGKLIEVQDVTPEPPPPRIKDYIFVESQAIVRCRINGVVIHDYGYEANTNDKEGSRVPRAIEKAKKMMAKLGPSDLEFIVVEKTEHTRYRPGEPRGYHADDKFVGFKSLDHGRGWNVPAETEVIVWSSKELPK